MNFINFKTILLIILVIGFLEFTNQDDFTPGDIALAPETKILAFGDSITYGYRTSPGDSYPEQLSKLLGVEVINAGKNGETTSEGLKRLPDLLEKHKPHILLLCEGGNDILRKKSLLDAKENLIKMVKMAQEKNIHVILIGVPKFDILTFETEPLYYEIATELTVPLEDKSLEEILEDNTLKVDNVHPNKYGYEIMAKKIAKLISESYFPSYSY